MTLFEVDEAATRIREEVDTDANIILGATFDESLEGVIRVSVVATGIEGSAGEGVMPNTQRMNEVAEQLRQSAAARTGSAAFATAAVAESDESIVVRQAADEAEVEEELALPEADDETPSVAPFTADAVDQLDPITDAEFQSALEQEIFEPSLGAFANTAPAATTPVAPAMPRASQLPPVAPATEVQKPTPAAAAPAEDNGPMGLLKRLATGLGSQAPEPAPVAKEEVQEPAPVMPIARKDDNPYAPPKNGSLDIHGRAAPAAPKSSSEEDQLDIPAFLRRQAN